MKLTYKEWKSHQECSSSYIIDYISPIGTGHIEVKTSFYNKYIKKFTKALKDCVITSFVEASVWKRKSWTWLLKSEWKFARI